MVLLCWLGRGRGDGVGMVAGHGVRIMWGGSLGIAVPIGQDVTAVPFWLAEMLFDPADIVAIDFPHL